MWTLILFHSRLTLHKLCSFWDCFLPSSSTNKIMSPAAVYLHTLSWVWSVACSDKISQEQQYSSDLMLEKHFHFGVINPSLNRTPSVSLENAFSIYFLSPLYKLHVTDMCNVCHNQSNLILLTNAVCKLYVRIWDSIKRLPDGVQINQWGPTKFASQYNTNKVLRVMHIFKLLGHQTWKSTNPSSCYATEVKGDWTYA